MAQLARGYLGFRARPGEGPIDPDLTPIRLRGYGLSVVVHLVLLGLLALWFFSPPAKRAGSFESGFAGTELGDKLERMEGLEQPLVNTAPERSQVDPTLKTLAAPEVALEPSTSADASKAETKTGGEGQGFGAARFGEGNETIQGIRVKVGDPQFTLIWNTGADIDLHIEEPGGAHIYWENPFGKRGGELDVDDRDGLGPENVYWNPEVGKDGKKTLNGHGPPGEYRWYIHYYGNFGGINLPTRWKVRVKHDGKVTVHEGRLNRIGDRSRIYTLKVD